MAGLAAGLTLTAGAASAGALAPINADTFVFDNQCNLFSGTFRVMLVDEVPARLAARRSDIAGEIVGEGYQAGGQPVTSSLSSAYEEAPAEFHVGGATWESSTLSAIGAVYFEDRGTAEEDIPLLYVDFGEVVANTRSTYVLEPSSIVLLPAPDGPGAGATAMRPAPAPLGSAAALRSTLAAMKGVCPIVYMDVGVRLMVCWPMVGGLVDWQTDRFAVMLVNGYFAPHPEQGWRSDIPPRAEVSGGGYQRLPVRAVVERGESAPDVTITLGGGLWPKADFGACGAVWYADRGSPERDLLLVYRNFAQGTAVIGGGGPFEVDPVDIDASS